MNTLFFKSMNVSNFCAAEKCAFSIFLLSFLLSTSGCSKKDSTDDGSGADQVELNEVASGEQFDGSSNAPAGDSSSEGSSSSAATNTAPEVSLSSLADMNSVLVGQNFLISFTSADEESSVEVALYYGNDALDCNEASIDSWVLITDSLTDSDTSYTWSTDVVGKFKLCARAKDTSDELTFAESEKDLFILPNDAVTWLKADQNVVEDLDGTVLEWIDNSDLGSNAEQIDDPSRQPTLTQSGINGRPSITFDGVDDYLDSIGTMTAFVGRTVFAVFQVDSATKSTSDLGQIWGQYETGIGHVATDFRPSTPNGFSFDGASTGTADYVLDQELQVSGVRNTTSVPWVDDQAHMIKAEFDSDRNFTNYVVGHLGETFGVTSHHYAGMISEILVFSDTLTEGEASLITDYLNQKYAIFP